jgi:antibiotic biosynthesis monooxygenase (ABM) superfamily enzyme
MLHDSRFEDPSGVVTVVVTRDVLPGRERDYEEWTHRIIYDAVPFGSLGAAVITPEGNTPGRRIVVHRFANEEAHKAWEESEERRALLREAEHVSVPHYQRATGLETWFALPDERAIVPPRWKMLPATFLGAYSLVVLLSAFVLPWVEGWPLLARAALLPVVVLTLMTYVVMPQLTRLLRRWLYPPQQHTPAQRFGGKHPRLPATYRPYRPHRL